MPVTKPTVTATVDDANGYVSITVSSFGTATSWTLYRNVEGYGDEFVRGVLSQATSVTTVIDVDFPQNKELQYRASVTDGSSTQTSDYATVNAPDLGVDALCVPGATAAGYAVTVTSMGEAQWGQRAETVMVVDRTDPVVVADRSTLPTFSLELWVDAPYTRSLLTAAINANPVVLFSPRWPGWAFEDGRPIYVAVTGRDESLYGGPSRGGRIVKLQCQRVGVPLIPVCTTAPSAPWVSTT